jgi:hypothetical protein
MRAERWRMLKSDGLIKTVQMDEENIIKESRSCRNPATLNTHIH